MSATVRLKRGVHADWDHVIMCSHRVASVIKLTTLTPFCWQIILHQPPINRQEKEPTMTKKIIDKISRLIPIKNKYAVKQEKGYRPIIEPITDKLLEKHLSGTGSPIGTYLIPAGSDSCTIGVLDIDNHEQDVLCERVREVGKALSDSLIKRGMYPEIFISGGGAGIHIFVFWDAPQLAYNIRCMLREVLGESGITEGTGGINKNEVEVFPKQDFVEAGRHGSLIAVPLARESKPLHRDTLEIVSLEEYAEKQLVSSQVLKDFFEEKKDVKSRKQPVDEDVICEN